MNNTNTKKQEFITVRVVNGSRLGNILFQYSFGRALCLEQEKKLKLDFREYINHFDIFGIQAVEQLSWFNLKAEIYNPLLLKILKKIKQYLLREKNNSDFELATDVPIPISGKYYQGYFQSEKYFKSFETVIRSDLLFRNFNKPKDVSILEENIRESHSVGLHVRRCDYLFHQTNLNPDYYKESLRIMRKANGKEIKLFVFSDDINWCKNVGWFMDAEYIDLRHHQQNAMLDFYLMSRCKHQIIANSTFSWWAGWLNPNPEKIIISPEIKENPDMIPASWITIRL